MKRFGKIQVLKALFYFKLKVKKVKLLKREHNVSMWKVWSNSGIYYLHQWTTKKNVPGLTFNMPKKKFYFGENVPVLINTRKGNYILEQDNYRFMLTGGLVVKRPTLARQKELVILLNKAPLKTLMKCKNYPEFENSEKSYDLNNSHDLNISMPSNYQNIGWEVEDLAFQTKKMLQQHANHLMQKSVDFINNQGRKFLHDLSVSAKKQYF